MGHPLLDRPAATRPVDSGHLHTPAARSVRAVPPLSVTVTVAVEAPRFTGPPFRSTGACNGGAHRARSIPSATLLGVDGQPVWVEVHVCERPARLPRRRPARRRRPRVARAGARRAAVVAASTCRSSAITVNLAPGNVRKTGAGLELAVALGAAGRRGPTCPRRARRRRRARRARARRLGPAGARARSCSSTRCAAPASRTVIVPMPTPPRPALLDGHARCAGADARRAARVPEGRAAVARSPTAPASARARRRRRRRRAPRPRRRARASPPPGVALEVAAAGSHHLIFAGPPGRRQDDARPPPPDDPAAARPRRTRSRSRASTPSPGGAPPRTARAPATVPARRTTPRRPPRSSAAAPAGPDRAR